MTRGAPPPEFQQVLNLHQQGNLDGAMKLCSEIMQRHPDHPAAYQFAAMVHCQAGRLEEGIAHLRKAIALGNDTPPMRFNLIRALFESGDLAGAEAECRALMPFINDAKFFCLYADVQKARGAVSEAVSLYERALTADRNILHAWNNLGNLYRDTGRSREAVIALKNAVRLAPDEPTVLFNLGTALKDENNLSDSLTALRRACDLDPGNADALTALGEVMSAMGNQADTVDIFRRVIELAPENADAHFNLGCAVAYNNDAVGAIDAFQEAIRLRPQFWPAYFNLISQLEKTSRLEEMDEALKVIEEEGVDHPVIPTLRAAYLKRKSDFESARKLLEATDVTNEPLTAVLHASLLGSVADRLGDTTAAFEAFQTMNRLEAARPYAAKFDKKVYLDRIDLMRQSFSSGDAENSDQQSELSPVFSVGFPRSGTTLLDTMLRGHDEIGVLEEVPIVDTLLDREGREQIYRGVGTEKLAQLRQDYLKEKEASVTEPGKSLWIDKLPLNLAEAGIIHRLFPNARFVLSLRHPCDCVLSCFMQQFAINHAMANFVTIEDAAHLYDKVMSLWTHYNEIYSLQVHQVRYEDLIAAPEETLVPLLEFLEVPWRDSVLEYRTTAKERANINTPSYHQVTEKLYSHASGRWERYGDQLEGVMPLLQPWIEKFGYAD